MRRTGRGSAADRTGPVTNPVDPRNPLAGIYLLVMLFDMSEGALRFLVPVLLESRGYGMAQVGVSVSAFAVATLLVRLPAGVLFSPRRARVLIVAAGTASTVAFVAAPFAPTLWLFILCMVLDGFGWGIATTALFGLMMSTRPPEIPARSAMGWYVGFTGIGHALAHLVGGLTGDLLGVETAMVLLAQFPLLASILLCWRMPAPAREAPRGAQDPAPGRTTTFGRTAVTRILSLPPAVWITCLTGVYLNVMNSIMNTFFPVLGLALGFSLAQIGSLASIRSGVSAAIRFVAVPILKYVSPQRLYLPMFVVSATTTAALPITTMYFAQAAVWVTNGASRGLLRVSTGTEALEDLGAGQEGPAAAVMSGGLDAGKILGPIAGGLAAEALGLEAMFHVVPLAFMAVFVALLLARRRTPTSTADVAGGRAAP